MTMDNSAKLPSMPRYHRRRRSASPPPPPPPWGHHGRRPPAPGQRRRRPFYRRRGNSATWTVLGPQGLAISWTSNLPWEVQPRPLTTDPPAEVPEPFRGNTLTDRHPNDPVQFYDEEERRLLCPLCGVSEIHRGTHQAGALHRARESAAAARAAVLRLAAIDEHNLQRALAVVRRLRPALLRPPSPADIAINIDENEEPF
ncbi:uncharacterized protein LOC115332114 [Ixodes scapularis]|uniref:uncharacterized protein LOC115332114 n=1 Tax=Ixodes scapularis TaxID=6945 RepID=UPI001A9DCCFB|nr:uncharacterized protein LOC115332114 [Ixodes scapularis]